MLFRSVGFSLPIHKLMSLNFGVSQAVKYNPDYQIYGDALYLTESAYVNFPITLAKMEKWGDIVWVPAASLSWNWDPTDITTRWDGISYTDLKGPDITIGHSLSMGRVDWIHNYRRGYSAKYVPVAFIRYLLKHVFNVFFRKRRILPCI